eukprot:COSAG01_NODE_1056_length_11893_cov_439.683332_12_plen_54_part_00
MTEPGSTNRAAGNVRFTALTTARFPVTAVPLIPQLCVRHVTATACAAATALVR